MQGLNEVRIIGTLGKDATLTYTQSGMAISKFSVAINERRKDKDGNWTDFTEWVNVTLFGKTAESLQQYLMKGTNVHVSGKFRTNKWEKDGQTHYSSEVACDRIILLGSKGDRQGQGAVPQQQSQQTPAQGQPRDDLNLAFPPESSGMDDLPF